MQAKGARRQDEREREREREAWEGPGGAPGSSADGPPSVLGLCPGGNPLRARPPW